MGFIEGMCPKCHELLQVPEDREKILCMYCGQEIETSAAAAALAEHQEIVSSRISGSEIYEDVKEDFLSMLEKVEDPMQGFKRQTYDGLFREYYRRNLYIIEAIEKAYCVAEDKEAFINTVAGDFVDRAKAQIDAIGKKRKQEDRQLKNNMAMVVYILPSIIEFKGSSSQVLSDRIVELWNDTFEKTNIKPSSFELINSGFKRRFCYITTAVCESLHKSDDCYELNILRSYRDNYLLQTDSGEEVVQEYYNIAPTVVKRINRRKDAGKIYQGIYDRYLKECIHLIEEDRMEECREVYTGMVLDLKEAYFLS